MFRLNSPLRLLSLLLISMLFACSQDMNKQEYAKSTMAKMPYAIAKVTGQDSIVPFIPNDKLMELCEILNVEQVNHAEIRYYPEFKDDEGETFPELYAINGIAQDGKFEFVIPLEVIENELCLYKNAITHACISRTTISSDCNCYNVRPGWGHRCGSSSEESNGCSSQVVFQKAVQDSEAIQDFFLTAGNF